MNIKRFINKRWRMFRLERCEKARRSLAKKSDADIEGVFRKDFLRDSIRNFQDRNNEFAGESPSGKAAAFGAAIRRFESYLPSHNANDECWGLN